MSGWQIIIQLLHTVPMQQWLQSVLSQFITTTSPETRVNFQFGDTMGTLARSMDTANESVVVRNGFARQREDDVEDDKVTCENALHLGLCLRRWSSMGRI